MCSYGMYVQTKSTEYQAGNEGNEVKEISSILQLLSISNKYIVTMHSISMPNSETHVLAGLVKSLLLSASLVGRHDIREAGRLVTPPLVSP